ncbi:MAG TPA: PGPGW domain-containing protein [Chthoniobacterales bacterium]|nr:PGPGW domain-containing protein [Chthoniobacterales bacterium]
MIKWFRSLTNKLGLDAMPRFRKVIVTVIGATIVMIGLALVVLPGPAFVVIPIGLAVLASEFAWARRVLRRGQVYATRVARTVRKKEREVVGR